MTEGAHEPDTKTRAARPRERRAHHHRRRLLAAVAVLAVGLFLGVGTHAGGFLRNGGGPDAGNPAAQAGKARSPGAATTGATDPNAPSAGFPAGNPADEPVPEEAPKAAERSLDVLVLGVDRRPDTAGGSSSRSDTMMLVRVTPETGRVRSLSVPRDLLVEVEPGVEDRINTAYAYGGVEQAAAAVENLTGVPTDRHAIVDFGGFEDVVDALGGVTLEVERPIRLGIEGRRVRIPAGRQELDGLEALAYARYRGTACGDLDRIRRQQRLVAALREQALGWNTVTELPGVVKVVHENVETNLGIVQAVSLGRALVGRGGDGGMRSSQLKGTPETLPNGDEVLVPDERANKKILENFRDDGPASPRQPPAPREGPSSEC